MMHSEKKSHLGKCIFVHGMSHSIFIKKCTMDENTLPEMEFFFLNASFESVDSTLLNDAFKKKSHLGKCIFVYGICMSLSSKKLIFLLKKFKIDEDTLPVMGFFF